MPTLVSPGVSVTIIDQSFYIPAAASTVPLFFIATRADKKQPDGVTDALGAQEFGVVRTITSLNSSVTNYGIPYFRTDNSGAELHGDVRNEYGLFALNQFLNIGNVAYVVRADVDLSDNDVITYSAGSVGYAGIGNGTLTGVVVNQNTAEAELWTITATSATNFTVTGFLSGVQAPATVGTPYNNGIVSFTIAAGATPFQAADVFSFTVSQSTQTNPLGSNQAAKRVTIATALIAQINLNQDVRSEIYEYNLILCPGYPETITDLLNLNQAINEEAFVIADTPFDKTPEDTAVWAMTVERQRSQNVAYYYPHCLASNLDGVEVFAAASGTALKVYAYSDDVSEVWFPPAGPRRGILTGLTDVGYISGYDDQVAQSATTFVSTPLNQGQRDVLYQFNANINIIPFFPGRGIMVFGQKTSYFAASALDRVNVMRMLIKIKRDIRKASFAYLFELNDRLTRESIKLMIDNYLNDIMVRRGLYDFVTLCDESNNTPTRIDRNELWVDIAVKPAKAIEFIYIPIRVLSTGA